MLVDLEYPLIEVAGGRLRRRRHPDPGSEIEEFDSIRMIAKECLPTLRRWLSSFNHILGNAGLANIDTELEKLAVDARRAPECIGDAHLPDQPAYLRRHRRPATTASRLPAPIRSETSAMPTDDCIRHRSLTSIICLK